MTQAPRVTVTDPEWREAWRALSLDERRAVDRAVSRGEALDDPRLAAVAAATAARRQRRPARLDGRPAGLAGVSWWVVAGALALGAVWLVGATLDGDRLSLALAAGYAVLAIALVVQGRRQLARLARAEARNRAVVERAARDRSPAA